MRVDGYVEAGRLMADYILLPDNLTRDISEVDGDGNGLVHLVFGTNHLNGVFQITIVGNGEKSKLLTQIVIEYAANQLILRRCGRRTDDDLYISRVGWSNMCHQFHSAFE